jgi:hypothetical protein
MRPPPPGWFSISNFTPSSASSRCGTSVRTKMSNPPPGLYGTMILTVLPEKKVAASSTLPFDAGASSSGLAVLPHAASTPTATTAATPTRLLLIREIRIFASLFGG